MGGKRAKKEEVEAIVQDYLAGTSPEVAAGKFGYSHMVLYRALEKRGIDTRRGRGNFHKYAVNDRYFEEVTTEHQAYWLGFITADGYVCHRRGALTVSLAKRDGGHVCKMLRDLESEHPVEARHVDGYPQSRVTIVRRPLVQPLLDLGLGGTKSYTATPWEGPEHLLPHYWRGLWDGDGHLYEKTGVVRWEVGLTGTKAIAMGFYSWLSDRIDGIRARPRPNGQNNWRLTVTGVALPQRVLRLLYGDATVWLDRKRALAEKVWALPVCLGGPR